MLFSQLKLFFFPFSLFLNPRYPGPQKANRTCWLYKQMIKIQVKNRNKRLSPKCYQKGRENTHTSTSLNVDDTSIYLYVY